MLIERRNSDKRITELEKRLRDEKEYLTNKVDSLEINLKRKDNEIEQMKKENEENLAASIENRSQFNNE